MSKIKDKEFRYLVTLLVSAHIATPRRDPIGPENMDKLISNCCDIVLKIDGTTKLPKTNNNPEDLVQFPNDERRQSGR